MFKINNDNYKYISLINLDKLISIILTIPTSSNTTIYIIILSFNSLC